MSASLRPFALVALLCAVLAPALPARAATSGSRLPPPGSAAYEALASELEDHLRETLSCWYPRCIDRDSGGFLERLGPDWSPLGESGKFLVYQARMTWVAARTARFAPDLREEFTGYALHGLDFLDSAMRDRLHGGVHFRLSAGPGGEWEPGDEKHAYGLAFAIYAGAAVHRLTEDPRALDLARETFLWLDRHAHDEEHGGYLESLTREGKPILTSLAVPGGATRAFDGIGTRFGYKSMNTHIHLLEAFTELHRVWPDAALGARLREMLHLVRDTIAVDPGCLNLFFTPEWRPVPAHDSFGHDVETAYLLVEAAEALEGGGSAEPRVERDAAWRRSIQIVDHALEWGFDEELGGFFEKGEAFAPAHDRTKVWWTQAEGLNALILLHARGEHDKAAGPGGGGEAAAPGRYWPALWKQWSFIREHQVDARHGGWHAHVSREGEPLGDGSKASPWKAAYHNVRALINGVETLRRLAADG